MHRPWYFWLTTSVIILSVCIEVIYLLSPGYTFPEAASTGFAVISLLSVVLPLAYLLWTGRLIRSYWLIPVILGVLLFLLGIVGKIQRWPIGGLLVFYAPQVIILFYLLYTLFKRSKHRSDAWKFLFVFVFFISLSFRLNHWPIAQLFPPLVYVVLLYLAFIDFRFFRKASDAKIADSQWDFDKAS